MRRYAWTHKSSETRFQDPAAYGLDRPPMLLPAIQQLLGHADIATTIIYTRVSDDDLARMMGMSEAP